MKTVWFSCFLLLLTVNVFSLGIIKNDSTITPAKITFDTYSLFFDTKKTKIDSSINNYHYLGTPSKKLIYDLGNVGSVVNVLEIGNINTTPFYFSYQRDKTSPFYFLPSIRFYDVHKPFTELNYLTGGNKQYINVLHTQNVSQRLNFVMNFNVYGVNGIYKNQKNNSTNMYLSSNYSSLNNRYSLKSFFTYANNRSGENGGLLVDSITNVSLDKSRKFSEVRNDVANRHLKSYSGGISQWYKLSNDSISQKLTHKIGHVFHGEYKKNIYSDSSPLMSSYNDFNVGLVSFTSVYDSIQINRFSNEVYYSGNLNLLDYRFSITEEVIDYNQNETNNYYYNTIARSYLKYQFTDKKVVDLKSNYVFTGYNKKDWNTTLSFKMLDTKNEFLINLGALRKENDIMFQQYTNVILNWNNLFSKKGKLFATVSYHNLKRNLTLKIDVSSINNYTYLNDKFVPQQLNKSIQLGRATLSKIINFHSFNLLVLGDGNYVSDNELLHLPNFKGFGSFYFENYVFKKAMLLQMGIDVSYFTNYYADAYFPLVGLFYAQQNRKYGNYPFIDVFVNAKIKGARVYLKMKHLNADFTGSNYYLRPHYAVQGRYLEFGVNWRFIN